MTVGSWEILGVWSWILGKRGKLSAGIGYEILWFKDFYGVYGEG